MATEEKCKFVYSILIIRAVVEARWEGRDSNLADWAAKSEHNFFRRESGDSRNRNNYVLEQHQRGEKKAKFGEFRAGRLSKLTTGFHA